MDISMLAKSSWGNRWIFKTSPLYKPLLQGNSYEHRTFRRGLSLVSIMKSYLQSSQQRVSELLIHWWRQDWWTKRRVPVQRQGVMRGLSSSPSQWQILGKDTGQVRSPTNRFAPSFTRGCIRNCTLSFRRHGHFIPAWCYNCLYDRYWFSFISLGIAQLLSHARRHHASTRKPILTAQLLSCVPAYSVKRVSVYGICFYT